MTELKLRVPYIPPLFRSLFNGTRIEDEQALDRSAPTAYWKDALQPEVYERFSKDPAAMLPWLTEKEKK